MNNKDRALIEQGRQEAINSLRDSFVGAGESPDDPSEGATAYNEAIAEAIETIEKLTTPQADLEAFKAFFDSMGVEYDVQGDLIIICGGSTCFRFSDGVFKTIRVNYMCDAYPRKVTP